MLRELKQVVRGLARTPGFTVVAVLTLALGVGACASVFSVVSRVLLESLPYPDAGKLVQFRPGHGPRIPVDRAGYGDWAGGLQSLESMARYSGGEFNLTGVPAPERIAAAEVSDAFFDVLGVRPVLGGGFSPGSDRLDQVVISDGLWRRQFEGRADVLGATLKLNGAAFEIVGVMPPGFAFPTGVEAWTPTAFALGRIPKRGAIFFFDIARLRRDVSLSQALAEVETQREDAGRAREPVLVRLHDHVVSDVRRSLELLFASVALVLLIACANVSGLLLARGVRKRHEFGVRQALGAGRWALMRRVLLESVTLASAGAVVGIVFAHWGVAVLESRRPPELEGWAGFGVDGEVLAFAVLLSVLSGVVAGLAPAWRIGRLEPATLVRRGGRYATAAGGRRWMLGFQVAVALALLVGAGLLIESLRLRQKRPLGFEPGGVLTIKLGAEDSEGRPGFLSRAMARLRALPGVTEVGAVSNLPYSEDSSMILGYTPEQAGGSADQTLGAVYLVADAGYFKAMRIPLRQGRLFDEGDHSGAPAVAVVNETFAKTLWPAGGAIGKQIRQGDDNSSSPWLTVVGVVGDVRNGGLPGPPLPDIYRPVKQAGWPEFVLTVKTDGNPGLLVAPAREELRRLGGMVLWVRTMDGWLSRANARNSYLAWLLGAFATMALLLVSVSLAGLVSETVAARTREIGVRIALGARPRLVVRSMLGGIVRPVALGLLAGAGAAGAATRFLEGMLFGVSTLEPAIWAGAMVTLLAAAALAAFLPARRAARVDPVVALREE